MSEPIDIRKYEFVSMPVKEQWGALVPLDTPLAKKDYIEPIDLVGVPIISVTGDIAQSNIGKWFGESLDKLNIIAKGNLLYNEAMLAQSNVGAVICIRLECNYDKLRFIPFSPALETTTALAWKKDQVYSASASTFIDFAKKFILGITDNYL